MIAALAANLISSGSESCRSCGSWLLSLHHPRIGDAKTRCRSCEWEVITSCVRICGSCDVVGCGLYQLRWIMVGERCRFRGLSSEEGIWRLQGHVIEWVSASVATQVLCLLYHIHRICGLIRCNYGLLQVRLESLQCLNGSD